MFVTIKNQPKGWNTCRDVHALLTSLRSHLFSYSIDREGDGGGKRRRKREVRVTGNKKIKNLLFSVLNYLPKMIQHIKDQVEIKEYSFFIVR